MTKTTALAMALAAIETLRNETRRDISSQTLSCFLHVALRGEIPMNDLIELLDLSGAAVSRNITLLGAGTPKDPGMGLVDSFEDPHYRRRKLVRLTGKGANLAEKAFGAMKTPAAEFI